VTTTTTPAAVEVVERQLPQVAEKAKAFVTITDDATMERAGTFLVHEVKAMLKLADEAFDPIISAAHKTHKLAVEKKKISTAGLLEAERVVKAAIARYAETKRAAAAAEQRRIEAEARQRAEDEREKQALALAEAGHAKAADALIEAPLVVEQPAPVVAPVAPKGVSVRTVFKFRIVDPSKINSAFMTPNETAIATMVRSQGVGAIAIVGAGIEVYEESVVSSRAS